MRAVLFTVTGAVMLIASMLAVAVAVAADMHYREDANNSITLTDKACQLEAITMHIQPAAVGGFHAGQTVYEGKEYPNCWRARPDDGVVVIIDVGSEAGVPDIYVVPIGVFGTEV